MFKNKKKRTLDEYINIAKWDIILYLIFNILILILSFIVIPLIIYYIFVFGLLTGRIYVYYNLKMIKKYIDKNNLLDDIGCIDYWNENNFFLTENYLIIKKFNNIKHILYNDIVSIKTDVDYEGIYFTYGNIHQRKKGLEIKGKNFKYIVKDSDLYMDSLENISDYLLNKNKNIIVYRN